MDAAFRIDMKIARMGEDDAAGTDGRKGLTVTDDPRSDSSRGIITGPADNDGLRKEACFCGKGRVSVPVTSGDS